MATQDLPDLDIRETVTISTYVARPWHEVYEQLWHAKQFPNWASGLSESDVSAEGDWWSGEGSEGHIRVKFTNRREFGILDHRVDIGNGTTAFIPLRVLENGKGAEVVLTLFRVPGISDAKFAEDQDWVRRDLASLKIWIEG